MKEKLKRFVAYIVAISIFSINIIITNAAGEFFGGTGTEQSPYMINTKAQLCKISQYPNAHYILLRDLEFTESDFSKGGVCEGGWNSPDEFTGVFNGMGNTISNLRGNDGGFVNVNNGTIDSVVFKNHNLSTDGATYYGAIADENNGTITRCYVKLSLNESTAPVAKVSGGVAGYNNGRISCSYVDGTLYVKGPKSDYCFIYTGGIAGKSGNSISKCYNDAYIYVDSPYITEYVYIGGICGQGDVNNCRSDGSMYIDARMDYDIEASPFGSHSSYNSRYCYGQLKCGSTDNYKLNRFNTHQNISCYNPAEIPETEIHFKDTYPLFDFEENWMMTADGPVPQGIMDSEGYCWSEKLYIAPKCEENGEVVFINQYDETMQEELAAIGHKPNENGKNCLRTGCVNNIITSISLDFTEAIMTEGTTLLLNCTYFPENATDTTLTWISSEESVATVDETGLVTAHNTGTATITVASNSSETAECVITVEKTAPRYPESNHPYDSNADEWQTYTCSEEGVLSLTIKFSDDSELEWNCDYVYVYDMNNNLVRKYTGSQISGAEVSLNGNSFKIRLTTDGSVTRYGYKVESVTSGYEEISSEIPVEELYTYSSGNIMANIGDIYYMDYYVYPDYTTSYLIWSSSDESIATVDENGVITVNGYGDVIINVSSSDGMCSYDTYLTISAPIYLNTYNMRLNKGDTFKLEYVSSTQTDNIPYFYDPDGIVSFNDDGTVTALNEGSFYTCEGHMFRDVYIEVTEGYCGYIVNDTYTILAGQEYPLPVTGVESEYLWGYSYDDAVAEYDSSTRTIKAINEGTCTIYTDYGCLEVQVIKPYTKCLFTVENGIITDYEGDAENLVIPSVIAGETIVGIGVRAFDADFKSVQIPGTIKTIGNHAFSWCSYLEKVVMEDGVEAIGENAFSLSRLKYIELPGSVKTIEDDAFYGCSPDTIIYNGNKSDWINLNIGRYNDCLEVISDTYGGIYTAEDLYRIAEAVNSNITNHSCKTFNLMNNISLGNREWIPICNQYGENDDYAFGGTFEGNGYTISDFRITTPGYYNGFFGSVKNGTVNDLTIKDAVIDITLSEEIQWAWTGAMIGWLYHGNMTNCHAEGIITVNGSSYSSDDNTGGLVGRLSGSTVADCSSKAKINIFAQKGADVGGLAGYMYGTIINSEAYADICYQSSSHADIGGICGFQASDSVSITNSIARGSINAIINGDEEYFSYIGGIIGRNQKHIENNKSYVDIVYSSKDNIDADVAVGSNYTYSATDTNNVGYGSLHRAPYVSLNVTQEEPSIYTCEYSINAPILSGKAIIVSLYNGDNLLENIQISQTNTNGTLTLSQNPDSYRIFVWDDFNSIAPVHKSLIYNIN